MQGWIRMIMISDRVIIRSDCNYSAVIVPQGIGVRNCEGTEQLHKLS